MSLGIKLIIAGGTSLLGSLFCFLFVYALAYLGIMVASQGGDHFFDERKYRWTYRISIILAIVGVALIVTGLCLGL
jgi:uncharacterized membrane protein